MDWFGEERHSRPAVAFVYPLFEIVGISPLGSVTIRIPPELAGEFAKAARENRLNGYMMESLRCFKVATGAFEMAPIDSQDPDSGSWWAICLQGMPQIMCHPTPEGVWHTHFGPGWEVFIKAAIEILYKS